MHFILNLGFIKSASSKVLYACGNIYLVLIIVTFFKKLEISIVNVSDHVF
jgi:hypothetical protein